MPSVNSLECEKCEKAHTRQFFATIGDSDAGWSSSVARRAHNPKVAGSNPAPATKFLCKRES